MTYRSMKDGSTLPYVGMKIYNIRQEKWFIDTLGMHSELVTSYHITVPTLLKRYIRAIAKRVDKFSSSQILELQEHARARLRKLIGKKEADAWK